MWFMPIDQSFFPSTEGLTTYIDETPHFTKKQLAILGSNDDEEPEFEERTDEQFREVESKGSFIETKFSIEKIFHAQLQRLDFCPRTKKTSARGGVGTVRR